MSYLLIKKGGQKPSPGLPSNRNNGQARRNPAPSSVNRHPGGDSGSSQSWRNPSSQLGGNAFSRFPSTRAGPSNQYHNGGESNQHGMAVAHDGAGQVQLQRIAPPVQRQQQVGQVQQQNQNQVANGLVSMDEGKRFINDGHLI